MGITPQTKANALKPYGLIYDLLKNYGVEIKWVINPDKKKDGIDFRIIEEDFRSGSFVVPVSYLTEELQIVIEKWESRGVVGKFLKESMVLPVYTKLSVAPKWTLDKQNGSIALAFFKAAGIPGEAHGGYDALNWKTPDELGVCDDLFIMPHAEPKFQSHKNLYYWNRTYKGAIWAGCHAGSELENLFGPVADKKDPEIIQLNFLSAGKPGVRTSGLVPFYEHRFATPPYNHELPADPVAQYIGKSDKAYINGSERILYPKKANAWRAGTKKIILDASAPDVPELSHGPGCILIYGHGFDDPRNGLVMYQVSHDISGNKPENIAAMRAFFNWSFYAAEIKRRENIIRFENEANNLIFAARVGDDILDKLGIEPILFELDKSEVRSQAREKLKILANYMQSYPELLLDIRSHTDSRADDSYNLSLSQQRVQATKEYLISMGVPETKISGRGYGETTPVNNCQNNVPCSEVLHEQNRRSEFILSINCELYSGNLKL
ncbi:OmpA family protein [Christiangramia aquimixticola]|uniref:OmpA family protein n=1 Tax=Christiangramia aquimixticola TaxID=1697558 RepID=UPI003AA96E89